LFKRALKYVATAAVLLAPTLASVAAAPPAHASPPGNTDNGKRIGQSTLAISHDESADPDCAQTWTSYYEATLDYGVANPAAQSMAGSNGNHFAPGASVDLHLSWSLPNYGLCANSFATSAVVSVKDMNGFVQASWTETQQMRGSATDYVTLTMPLYAGNYYLGISLVGGNENGASTEGGCCTGLHSPNDNLINAYAKGLVSFGYMAGMYDQPAGTNTTTRFDTDEGLLLKSTSLTRVFKATWNLPPVTVSNYASANVGVIFDISSPKNTVDPNIAQDPSVSKWGTLATTHMDHHTVGGVDVGLVAIVTSLYNTAKNNNVPIYFGLWHEPNGQWYDNCQSAGCNGNYADYKNMYHHLESVVQSVAGVGSPYLRTIYIEVDSQAKLTNDPFRPADADYDVMGADLYNYYQFQCNPSCTGWKYASDANKLGVASTTGTGILAQAVIHNKHLILPEMGTHPGCPGGYNGVTPPSVEDANCGSITTGYSKDLYFQDLATLLTDTTRSDAWYIQSLFIGFAYYNFVTTKHDWEFVNREHPTVNNESQCQIPLALNKTCWNGTANTGDHDAAGWGNSFVTDSHYNDRNSGWFAGVVQGTGSANRVPLFG
jgi:hypothetical protein